MTKLCVRGGTPLQGALRVCGAKNSILPIIGAALLTEDIIRLQDVPRLSDVDNMLEILKALGCSHDWKDTELFIDAKSADNYQMPDELSKQMRSSIFMLGPVVARFSKARFTYPGGCDIGNRPIDLHIKGLRALNVTVTEEHGYINCDGSNMKGASIHLDYPSVGATENIMMAATAAKGKTTILNVAREPEISDLQKLLCAMGAHVSGAGSSTIVVEGGHTLHGASHKVLSDRILAGTLLVGAAISGGDITLTNVHADHLHSVISKLEECGCRLSVQPTSIRIQAPARPKEMHIIETLPYPGFPTDMQAQLFALCCVADGTSVIVENVFENRFKHAAELACMGACATIKDRMAIIRGVEQLTGANVRARDLRGGAALMLAGLRAQGVTKVACAEYIDRGYEALELTLNQLGAQAWREDE